MNRNHAQSCQCSHQTLFPSLLHITFTHSREWRGKRRVYQSLIHLVICCVIRLAIRGARSRSGFPTWVTRDKWRERFIRTNMYAHMNVRTHVKTVHSQWDRGILMFVQVARQGRARMCKCGIIIELFGHFQELFWKISRNTY